MISSTHNGLWSAHVDPRCRGDQVYSDCATSCGVTCDNHEYPPQCDDFCVEGCTCPPGLIPLTSDPSETKCVSPDECPAPPGKVCSLKPETGNCRRVYMQRKLQAGLHATYTCPELLSD